jgi:hypothetical protein
LVVFCIVVKSFKKLFYVFKFWKNWSQAGLSCSSSWLKGGRVCLLFTGVLAVVVKSQGIKTDLLQNSIGGESIS